MTPKEKAIELVDKFKNYADENYHDCAYQHELNDARAKNAIQCALIAVNEILEVTKTEIDRPDYNGVVLDKYWQEVKTELENYETRRNINT